MFADHKKLVEQVQNIDANDVKLADQVKEINTNYAILVGRANTEVITKQINLSEKTNELVDRVSIINNTRVEHASKLAALSSSIERTRDA